jgi:hypothetical protein
MKAGRHVHGVEVLQLRYGTIRAMNSNRLSQVNVRVDRDMEKALDAKRIELSEQVGYIPSRSEVIRLAIDAYLGVKPPLAKPSTDKSK